MKHRSIFIYLFLLLASCQNSEEILSRNDLLIENLKGNVKVIETKLYKAIDKFGEIIQSDFVYCQIQKFDKNGFLIETISNDSSSNVLWLTKYKYNEQGLISNQIEYNEVGKKQSQTRYKYKNNQLIKKSAIGENNELINEQTYFYNAEGHLIKSQIKYSSTDRVVSTDYINDKNGKPIEKYQDDTGYQYYYSYDQSGNETHNLWLSKSNDTLSFYKKSYDLNDNCITKKIIDNVWNTFGVDSSIYDKYGNVMEFYWKDLGDTYFGEGSIYQFQYDKKGNWIQKTAFFKQTPYEITHRLIEYY